MLAPVDFRFHLFDRMLALKSPRGFTMIELLVVIAIIGILMSLLFPAVQSALDAAKKAEAKNDVTQIAAATVAFDAEYGRLPPNPSSNVNPALVDILTGADTNNNPRKIVFLEVRAAKKGKSGTNAGGFVDPWGGIYQFAIDDNYDNRMTNTVPSLTNTGTESVQIVKKVAVWNTNSNRHRLVRSWE